MIKNEKGYTMPAAMATVVILAVMVTAVSTLALSTIRRSTMWNDQAAALYLAESGINDAVYRIYEAGEPLAIKTYGIDPDPSYTSGAVYYNLGAGKDFAVWVSRDVYGQYKITSKGTSRKIPRVVEQELILPAVFPQNSNGGTYIETTAERPNYVPGYTPPVINVTMPSGVTYTGFTGQTSLSAGTYYFNGLSLATNGSLAVQGPATVYVRGDMNLENGAVITADGDVTFQVEGSLIFKNNNTFTNTNGKAAFYVGGAVSIKNGNTFGSGDPTKLVIYSNGEVEIDNGVNFSGGICASGEVEIKNVGTMNGALVGKTVDFGSTTYTYDWRMQGITSRDRFTLGGWSEK